MNISAALEADFNDIVEDIRRGFTKDCEVVIDGKYVLDGQWHPGDGGYVWWNFGGAEYKAVAPEYDSVFHLGGE